MLTCNSEVHSVIDWIDCLSKDCTPLTLLLSFSSQTSSSFTFRELYPSHGTYCKNLILFDFKCSLSLCNSNLDPVPSASFRYYRNILCISKQQHTSAMTMSSCGLERLLMQTLINSSKKNCRKEQKMSACNL